MGVGLYIERKGIIDFVELAKRLPEYKFIWFGYSPLAASPAKIRKAVNTKLDNLVFAGYVEPEVLRGAYSGCDLYLFPTLEETEGIPIMEACAARIPAIIRDIPVFDEWLVDGVNVYKAKDVDEFEKKIKENGFLEYAQYNENYYGTPKANIEKQLNEGKDVLLEIEIQGALQIKEKIKDALFIFVLPPSMEELKKRLILRNTEDNEKILKRFKRAYIEINELPKYNYVVINDDLDIAVKQIEAILLAERLKVERIEEVYVGNQEEVIHELLSNKDFQNSISEIK